jgi:PAS domain S-box-containing protein
VIDAPLRVLLVDDDPADADSVREALVQVPDATFEVEWVDDLSAALERVASETVDVALLNVSRADGGGAPTFSGVRTAAPHLPIVLLADPDDQGLATSLLQKGADECLTKPNLRPAPLLRVIRSTMGRQQAMRELAESERRYRHLFEQSHGYICTHAADGNVLSVNPAAAEALGYDPDEMVDCNLSDFLAPRVRRLFPVYLERIGKTGKDAGMLRVVTRSGEVRVWAYRNARYEPPSGEPYVVGYAQDVTEIVEAGAVLRSAKRELEIRVAERTAELAEANKRLTAELAERRQAQQELRESEERYRGLFESTHDLIQSVDPDGRLILVNRAWLEVLGYTESEVPNLRFVNIAHPDAVAECRCLLDRIRGGELVDRVSTMFITKDGRSILVEGSGCAGDVDGRIVVHLFCRDVTARVQAERELQDARAMAAMGSLVAGVAHEVRNPLFSISAALDAMEVRFDDETLELGRYIEVLRKGMDRVNELMHDLLEYGKPHRSERELGSIQGVVEEAIQSCQAATHANNITVVNRLSECCAAAQDGGEAAMQSYQARSRPNNAAIAGRLQERCDSVPMDRVRLVRVFLNVLLNAIQHSPRDGIVTIAAQRTQHRGRPWTECTISDRGPGFPVHNVWKVFEPFYSLRAGGTGLGLSIAQQIVEEHLGKIWVGNRHEGGAVVRLAFPLGDHGGPAGSGGKCR